jgi:hypothetical protein
MRPGPIDEVMIAPMDVGIYGVIIVDELDMKKTTVG